MLCLCFEFSRTLLLSERFGKINSQIAADKSYEFSARVWTINWAFAFSSSGSSLCFVNETKCDKTTRQTSLWSFRVVMIALNILNIFIVFFLDEKIKFILRKIWWSEPTNQRPRALIPFRVHLSTSKRAAMWTAALQHTSKRGASGAWSIETSSDKMIWFIRAVWPGKPDEASSLQLIQFKTMRNLFSFRSASLVVRTQLL